MARTVGGTWQLEEDFRGLHFTASVNPDDRDVQWLAPKIARRDVCQCSFAFRCLKQSFDDDYEHRYLASTPKSHRMP